MTICSRLQIAKKRKTGYLQSPQIFAIDTCSQLQIMSKNGQIMMCLNVFSFIFEHVKNVSGM